VFDSPAQASAAFVPNLLRRAARRCRVEFVRETRDETAEILGAYRELLAGRVTPADDAKRAGALARCGISIAPIAVTTSLSR